MTTTNASLRKAAILVASLDRRSADVLLDQMRPEQSNEIRHAVRKLGTVDSGERSQVIDEFVRVGAMVPGAQVTGIELDSSLASKLTSRTYDPSADASPTLVSDSPPFQFLHEAAGETLTPILAREHPQTIAVVLSSLPPERAGDVLTRLSSQLQVEVIRRLVGLDAAEPEIIREVEQELESLLSARKHDPRRRAAGLAAVSAILDAADRSQRQEILTTLARHDQSLADRLVCCDTPPLSEPVISHVAEPDGSDHADSHQLDQADVARSEDAEPFEEVEVRDHAYPHPQSHSAESHPAQSHEVQLTSNAEPSIPLDFDDVTELDTPSLAAVLGAAGPELAILALTGANHALVERIVNSLPKREGKLLRVKLNHVGPLRLRDVEHAQLEIARLASQLAATGAINVPPSRRVALASQRECLAVGDSGDQPPGTTHIPSNRPAPR